MASHTVVASVVSHTAFFQRVVLPAAVVDVCAVGESLDSGLKILVPLVAVAAAAVVVVVVVVVEPVAVEVAVAYLVQAA